MKQTFFRSEKLSRAARMTTLSPLFSTRIRFSGFRSANSAFCGTNWTRIALSLFYYWTQLGKNLNRNSRAIGRLCTDASHGSVRMLFAHKAFPNPSVCECTFCDGLGKRITCARRRVLALFWHGAKTNFLITLLPKTTQHPSPGSTPKHLPQVPRGCLNR